MSWLPESLEMLVFQEYLEVFTCIAFCVLGKPGCGLSGCAERGHPSVLTVLRLSCSMKKEITTLHGQPTDTLGQKIC